jgi:hypothetical protein
MGRRQVFGMFGAESGIPRFRDEAGTGTQADAL